MIGVQESKAVFSLLNSSESRTFDEIFKDFSSQFQRDSRFRICCAIAMLLEAKNLDPWVYVSFLISFLGFRIKPQRLLQIFLGSFFFALCACKMSFYQGPWHARIGIGLGLFGGGVRFCWGFKLEFCWIKRGRVEYLLRFTLNHKLRKKLLTLNYMVLNVNCIFQGFEFPRFTGTKYSRKALYYLCRHLSSLSKYESVS